MMILISLLAINTAITKRGLELSHHTKFMVQVNSLLVDIVKLFSTKVVFVKDSATLLLLTNTDINLNESKAGLHITIDIDSAASRLNINQILSSASTKNQPIYDIMVNILQAYNVNDIDFFLNVVMDTIDSDKKERFYQSEIILVQDDFENSRIYSHQHLSQIIAYYKEKIGDNNIDSVPWQQLIQFHSDEMDINYMPPKLLAYVLNRNEEEITLLLQDNIPISDMNTLFTQADKDKLSQVGIKVFVPHIEAKVNMKVFEREAKASFSYDLDSKKADNVRIDTQYLR